MTMSEVSNSKPKVEGAKPAPLNQKKIDIKTKIYRNKYLKKYPHNSMLWIEGNEV